MVLYPDEIDLESIVRLYYNISSIHEVKPKYFTVMVNDKVIACAEKFSKYPDGVDGYFTLSKSSSKTGAVTLPMIKKVIPELVIEEREVSNFFKLKRYLRVSKGKYPMNYENEELYHYIRDMCDGKECLPVEDREQLESLPGWYWDYSRLTKEGEKFSGVLDSVQKGIELDETQKKILKLMLTRLEKGTLSPYFENRVRYLGLNLQ